MCLYDNTRDDVGIEAQDTQILHDPTQLQLTYKQLIDSAIHEILLIVPAVNAFYRDQNLAIIDSILKEAQMLVATRGVVPNLVISDLFHR